MKNDLNAMALEAYRNSAEYPDHPRLGIYGRINKAFEDGYNTGFIQAALPAAQLAERDISHYKAREAMADAAEEMLRRIQSDIRSPRRIYRTYWIDQIDALLGTASK